LLLASTIVFAQVTAPASPLPSTPTEELQVLKAQIATTQQYQEQFVSMVQWSLGAVLAMALGLAAFNWYSSKVSYERDIASLRQENKALHAELSALIKIETEASAKRLIESLSERQADIQAAVAKALESKLAKHSADISQLNSKILELRYTLTELEAEDAEGEKRYAWAIYKYCDLLDISVKNASDHYQVGEILDVIGKLLENPATSLSADDVTHAVEALKRLPQRYQAAAQNLIPRINRAHK
jgi:chromosome segregation ATPase